MEQQILKGIEILVGIAISLLAPSVGSIFLTLRKVAKQKIGDAKEKAFEGYALKVVNAIAQKYGTLENEQKFVKAISLLEAKFGVNFLTDDEIEVLLEDAVAKLKLAKSQIATQITTPVADVPVEEVKVAETLPVDDPKSTETTPIPTEIEQKPVEDPNSQVENTSNVEQITTSVVDNTTAEAPVVVETPTTIVTDDIANAITALVSSKVTEAVNQTILDTKAQTIASIINGITQQAQ